MVQEGDLSTGFLEKLEISRKGEWASLDLWPFRQLVQLVTGVCFVSFPQDSN